MSIEPVNLSTESKFEELTTKINLRLDLAHKQKAKMTELFNTISKKQYTDTYDGLKLKLEDKLDLSFNSSQLISLLVLIRSEMDQFSRNASFLSLSSRLPNAIKLLSDDITAYKAITFSLSSELTAIKELIAVKFPTDRFNIS